MEQYIPKSDLVAGIKKRQSKHDEKKYDYASSDHFWASVEDEKILSLIDTIETKEIDIDKLCEFRKNIGFAYPEGVSEYQKHLACYRQEIEDVLKAQKGE